MRIRTGTSAFVLALGIVLSVPAAAHDAVKGPHGGQQVSVQDKHLELTTSGAEIAVYVTNAKHEPLALTGATGKAVVQMGGKTSTVELAAAEGNRLAGKAEAPIAKGARIVVSASLAGGFSLHARFVVN